MLRLSSIFCVSIRTEVLLSALAKSYIIVQETNLISLLISTSNWLMSMLCASLKGIPYSSGNEAIEYFNIGGCRDYVHHWKSYLIAQTTTSKYVLTLISYMSIYLLIRSMLHILYLSSLLKTKNTENQPLHVSFFSVIAIRAVGELLSIRCQTITRVISHM